MRQTYFGLCDASAAVMLDETTFVVADDEHNHLRYYRLGRRQSVGSLGLNRFLEIERHGKESDVEGAARIGFRTWWIGSHSRNPKGDRQPNRECLFALDLSHTSEGVRLVPAGRPFRRLLEALIAADTNWGLGLKQASQMAAEASGGLNIEGLAAWHKGGLVIGFRNPLIEGKALLVPLLNPEDLIGEDNDDPDLLRFGDPILLDLGERGIRDLERDGERYLVVAGPTADDGTFRLFRWSGKRGARPRDLGPRFERSLHPEAVFVLSGERQAVILSDDGTREVDGKTCQDLPQAERRFRSLTVDLPR